MLYKIKTNDNLNSVAKHFGYTDMAKFFKTIHYVGPTHAFIPGIVIECPSEPTSSRDRPYNGQPHTDEGVRGQTFVEGLTMRDVIDCYYRAILQSTGDQDMNLIASEGDMIAVHNAISDKVDWREIDYVALGQNLGCEIERMMDIFPNLPEEFRVSNETKKEWEKSDAKFHGKN